MKKIIRSATVGLSLNIFCKGLLREMTAEGYEVLALSTPDQDLEELGVRENVRTIGVNMERHISLWKDAVALIHLIRIFAKERPMMVHSITPKAGLLCMIAAFVTRVPIRLHTFTGLVWPTATGMNKKLLMLTDKLTCACATHIIPEGQGVLNDLHYFGITSKPMKVLGYGNIRGVDMECYSLRPEVLTLAEKWRESGIFRFVFVGRVVGDKGINELVRAFVDLTRNGKEMFQHAKLALIGWIEDKLDPVSSETLWLIESTPSIEAVGPLFGDDLLAYYAASDCFVFPSYREGFPNTVLEAGAMGLPSIVTDINGSREIVVDYKKDPENATGLIVPSKNTEALLEAMEWMVTHEEERKLMAANARPRIEQRWEQGFVRGCLLDFYRSVLS